MPKTPRGKNTMQDDEHKLTKKVIGSMTAVIPSEKNADTDQTPKKQKTATTAFEHSATAKGEPMSLLDQIMVQQDESGKSGTGPRSQKSVMGDNSASFLKKRKSTIPNNQDIQATLVEDHSPY